MSSLTRRIQRKASRRLGMAPSDKEMPYRDTGRHIVALHTTKGWRWISKKRMAAQHAMATVLDHVIRRKQPKQPKLYREVANRIVAGRKLAAKFPGTVTRQRRRHAKRKGLAAPA